MASVRWVAESVQGTHPWFYCSTRLDLLKMPGVLDFTSLQLASVLTCWWPKQWHILVYPRQSSIAECCASLDCRSMYKSCASPAPSTAPVGLSLWLLWVTVRSQWTILDIPLHIFFFLINKQLKAENFLSKA